MGRLVLFVAWALIGAVASYGLLYALTFYGLAILSVCLVVALSLPRGFESVGLLAGPGILLIVAATAG